MSVAYTTLFVIFQLPVVFGADWIPYGAINIIFSAGYIYPTLTLLVLWAIAFFLEGVSLLEKECPEIFEKPEI